MKFDLTKINFSRMDHFRGLKLPTEMNEKLAEDIGIMVGDGHIGRYYYGGRTYHEILVSCDAMTDRNYVLEHILKLKNNLYSLPFGVFYMGKRKSEIRLVKHSQGLWEFYTKIIGLPSGRKENIGIPKICWKSKPVLGAFLRGLIDTDFSFGIKQRNYPVLKLGTVSKQLVTDCKKAFNILHIKPSIKTDCIHVHNKTKRPYTTHYLHISGHSKVQSVIKQIGFSNEKNLIKLKNYGPIGIRTQDLLVKSQSLLATLCFYQTELWAQVKKFRTDLYLKNYLNHLKLSGHFVDFIFQIWANAQAGNSSWLQNSMTSVFYQSNL
jgi:hypothetical protein